MTLEIKTIAEFLPSSRWFGTDQAIESIEVYDESLLDDGPPDLVLALLAVRLVDGEERLYQVPLLVEHDGTLRDGFTDPKRLRAFGRALAHGDSLGGRNGTFRFGGPGLDPLSPPGNESVRAMGAEQSNSSLVLDEAVILKLIRRLEPGQNPELELNRFLTNVGYENIPPQLGEIYYERDVEEGEPAVNIDLGIAQQFVPDAADGWSTTLDALRALYDSADSSDELDGVVEDRSADILDRLGELAEATAALHVTLGRGEEGDTTILSEVISGVDLKEWTDRALDTLNSLTGGRVAQLDAIADKTAVRIERLREVHEPGFKIRIHGDYHLGQTLIGPRGWLILDFEGEPARPLEMRREFQSPLRDVAGMLRSFSYVSSAALFERAEPDSKEWRRLEPWARAWERVARDRYLREYRRTSHEGGFLPPDDDDLAIMLATFEIDKALYEVAYEIGHRPDWIRIPLRGIVDVLESGEE